MQTLPVTVVDGKESESLRYIPNRAVNQGKEKLPYKAYLYAPRLPSHSKTLTNHQEDNMSGETAPPTIQSHPAFDISEILVAILLNVDMRTLLVSAQRTCKYWYMLIFRSIRLQQHLFFDPDLSARRELNPLLQETFPFCFRKHEATNDVYQQHMRTVFLHIQNKSIAFNRPQASVRNQLLSMSPLVLF